MKQKLILASVAALIGFSAVVYFGVPVADAVRPTDFGLKEGDLISAIFSDDPDVYIINENGYKRLFLNPEIFKFYAHLGGFANVKLVTPEIRDSFPTSGFFRNCEDNDQKVFGTSVEGEDTGRLHWINKSGDQAVQEDPEFFKKVFCINRKEFSWYPRGNEFKTLKEVPEYVRKEEAAPYVICHHPSDDPKTFQTIRVAPESLDAHFQHGDTKGACASAFQTSQPLLVTPIPEVPTQPALFAANPIILVSPNGGEWKMGQAYEIRWKQIENTPVTIELQNKQLVEGYSPWYSTAIAKIDGKAGENSYSWTIPSNLNPHTGYEICVVVPYTVGSAGSTFRDCSEPAFYISSSEIVKPSSPLSIGSPNGGEIFQKGTTQIIKWNSSNVSKIYIKLRKGNDTYPGTEGMIADVMPNLNGYFKWWIPITLPDGNDYYVRVIDGNLTGVFDDSDKPFSIVSTATQTPTLTPMVSPLPSTTPTPSIIVFSPNGGEQWQSGNYYEVRWTNTTGKSINLELIKGNNVVASWSPIGSTVSVYNVGLPLPLETGSDYRIKITTVDTSNVDFSDAPFNIVSMATPTPTPTISPLLKTQMLKVTSPNGGEQWTIGPKYTIQWENPGLINGVSVELYKGGVYLSGLGGLGYTYGAPTSWTWNTIDTPNFVPGLDFKIRIKSGTDSTIYDESDNDFSINITKPSPTTCDYLISDPATSPYFTQCSSGGDISYDNTCFNKFYSTFQGCTQSTYNGCTLNNANASQNISCPVSGVATPAPTASPSYSPTPAVQSNFSRNLTVGSTGDDVKQLQALLANEVNYPADLITGYFGRITRDAVKRLQTKYSVKPVSGYFGELTRRALNALVSN